MAKNIEHIQHIKSSVVENGGPKLPNPSALTEGEIAINYAEGVETISIKNSSEDIVTFSSDNYFINEKSGFKRITNPTASTNVGLVNSLSKYYDTNIGKGAVIEGDGYKYNGTTYNIVASGELSHAEGFYVRASGADSHAEGSHTQASEYCSHAEGCYTQANGNSSHAEGNNTIAIGSQSHAEGNETKASGNYSHTEGAYTQASGTCAHAEGDNTKANGNNSHAEGGNNTTASGNESHAEGNGTQAIGQYSHAEGILTKANGDYGSHAEGQSTTASGWCAHAEGQRTQAIGYYSHAEGQDTIASGQYCAHAEGQGTIASNNSEHASGQFNVSSKASTTFGDSGNTLFSVGNGTSQSARHNAFEIRQNGDIYITSGGTDILLQDHLGGVVDQVIDSGTSASTNAVATKAVYDAITYNELVWTNAYVALSGAVSSHTANTIIHVTQTDKTAWNNKVDSTDIANFFDDAKYEDSGTSKVINFYHGNTIKATINADDFIIDGMVDDVRIETVAGSGTCLVIDFNTASGKQDINIPISDIFDASNYYTKQEVDNKLGTGFSVSSVTEVIESNERVTATALNSLNTKVGSGFSSSSITEVIKENELVTSEALNDLDGRIGSGFSVSSVTKVMESKADKEEDLDGIKLKKITQSAYDALEQAGTLDPNTLYIITDDNS